MVKMRTLLNVADNSGARKISCILPLGGSVGNTATVGDIITASIKEAEPESKQKKGSVCSQALLLLLKQL